MKTEQFVKEVNQRRLQLNGAGWINAVETVEGCEVRFKSFKTSIQILDVDGIRHGSTYDQTVKAWKQSIVDAIEYGIKNK